MSDAVATLRAALARRYEIRTEIGRGAFAGVYLALDLRHDREVAIKVLDVDPSSQLGELRFVREIKVLARLQHPHILPLYDSGFVGELLYYVTPYLSGESLRGRITRERRLPLGDAIQIARECAEGLHFAHRHGIVHRDIKPENILLSDGHAVVADFGIARVVAADGALAGRLTKPGFGSPGTPAYMSPEQLLGEGETDARSDVYALGCVLFEMLTGKPPFAGKEGFARRFTEVAPSVGAARQEVPSVLSVLVARALERQPEARFASAHALGEALAAAAHHLAGPGSAARPGPDARIAAQGEESVSSRPPLAPPAAAASRLSGPANTARRGWGVAVASGIVLLATAAAVAIPTLSHRRPSPRLNTDLYVILPFGDRGGAGAAALTGENVATILADALGRWRDVRQIGPLRVSDAIARRHPPRALREAVDIARALGAGRLLWGQLGRIRDTIVIRAALVDVGSEEPIRERTVRVSAAGGNASGLLTQLLDALIAGDASGSMADPSRDAGTVSLAAWQAYERGRSALGRWDLAVAEHELSAARSLDPDFARAALWLAEVFSWTGAGYDDPEAWTSAALQAHVRRQTLSTKESILAAGLHALSEGRYPEACAEYRRLLATDSLDVSAWHGLGECNARDTIVVRDPQSPSGWSFRSSYHAALDAYERAFRLVPAAHAAFRGLAVSRLDVLLFTDPTLFRPGVAVIDDRPMRFAAFPSVNNDTLAFVPYTVDAVRARRPGTVPATLMIAVARNRAAASRITQSWVAAFPQSAPAHEAFALALEAAGQLDSAAASASAVREVVTARRLAAEPADGMRLALSEVRLRIKTRDFARAGFLADSLLGVAPPSPAAETLLVGLAILAGRPTRAAALAGRESVTDATPLPSAVGHAVRALAVYAAAGTPRESITVLRVRVERLLRAHAGGGQRDRLRATVLARPASFAVPVVGLRATAGLDTRYNTHLLLLNELARRDYAAVRRGIAVIDSVRSATNAPRTSIDAAYIEAWLQTAIGDTARAVRRLDAALIDLSYLRTGFLADVWEPGALVRAIALRAELADRTGEMETALSWGAALAALWSTGEEAVRPMVERMREVGTRGARR